MFRRIIFTTAASLLAFGPLSAQDTVTSDFERYLELWDELVDHIGEASPEACTQGADAAREWADKHLREIIEIEKRLADAGGGDDPLAVLDSTETERLANQFSTSFERWMDWGFACIESPEAVAAGEYVEQRRAELELEILGEPEVYSQLEDDLGALDDPRSQAQQAVSDGERLAQSGNIDLALRILERPRHHSFDLHLAQLEVLAVSAVAHVVTERKFSLWPSFVGTGVDQILLHHRDAISDLSFFSLQLRRAQRNGYSRPLEQVLQPTDD